MLYPIQTESRALIDLSGIWQFQLDDATETIDPCLPLPNSQPIAVPASFNEQFADPSIRNHAGYVWYQTSFNLPHFLTDERLVLRFGSVTHEAWVYLNGHKIAHHKGGFTPFEVEINDYLQADNQLTIRISNLLDYTTLPVGNYNEEMDEQGHLIRTVDENFDFFNYAGIHRPVKIYSTPKSYIQDIEIVPEVDFDTLTAHIQTTISAHGDYDKIHLQILDEDNQQVADADGTNAELTIKNVHLWQPLDAYLYTLRVNLIKHNQIVDTYSEPFGVRTVEVKNAQFLINNLNSPDF